MSEEVGKDFKSEEERLAAKNFNQSGSPFIEALGNAPYKSRQHLHTLGSDKVVRTEPFNHTDPTSEKVNYSTLEEYKTLRSLTIELEDKYGLRVVPYNVVAGQNTVSNQAGIMTVSEKIEGRNLAEIKQSYDGEYEKYQAKQVEFLSNLTRYLISKYKEKGLILSDIVSQSQWVYGKRISDTENNIYLVDVDPLFFSIEPGQSQHLFFYLFQHLWQMLGTAEYNGAGVNHIYDEIQTFLESIEENDPNYSNTFTLKQMLADRKSTHNL